MRLQFIIVIVMINVFELYGHLLLTTVVQTDKGPVQGEIFKTFRKSTAFSSFRGIPYGKPPTGYNRFKAPEEVDTWTETFQATAEATPCPQLDFFDGKNYIGNEDCLNLNVYTPKTVFSTGNNDTSDNLLPVMVWIYGGGFRCGYTNMTYYGPDFFIENDVVVVAMNYRLGAFGFLALNLPNVTGNAGLKDQLLALKWTQRNIKAFGGDPESVTIFGQSGGGIAVDYHVLSDRSKGLFHRAISMSGSAINFFSFSTTADAESQALKFGRLLEINTNDKETLLAALYKEPAENLVRATAKIITVEPPFKPTLENTAIAGDTAFITKCNVGKLRSGNFNQLPYIGGFLTNEMMFFAISLAMDAALNVTHPIKSSTALDFLPMFPKLIENAGVPIEELSLDTLTEIYQDFTDIVYVTAMNTNIKIHANYSKAPVYYYRNNFVTNSSLHKLQNGIDLMGALHGDDLAYLWHIKLVDLPTDVNHPLVIMRDRMSRMWTNFAKYSNPTPHGVNDPLLNLTWPVFEKNEFYLLIDEQFSINKIAVDGKMNVFEQAYNLTLSDFFQCYSIDCENFDNTIFHYESQLVLIVLINTVSIIVVSFVYYKTTV